ncbi:MAG: hypothetical protein HY665_05330 [Chloroflexi bacterium]|nr:hypothetical protein [Chloroflexota bacterium]
MVTQNLPMPQPMDLPRVLSIMGVSIAIFSAISGLLVTFVLPSKCSFLSGLEVVFLTGFFFFGLILFAIGQILKRRRKAII